MLASKYGGGIFSQMYYFHETNSLYFFQKGSTSSTISKVNILDDKILTKYTSNMASISDIFIDEVNNILVVFNQETSNNLLKFDLKENKYSYFINGHKMAILKVFLDNKSDILISQSSDCTYIIWQYSTGNKLYTFEEHLNL